MDRNEKKLRKAIAQHALGWTVRKERQKEARLRKAMRPAPRKERAPGLDWEDWEELDVARPQRLAPTVTRRRAAVTPPGGERTHELGAVVVGIAGGLVRLWRDGDELLAPLSRNLPPLVPGDEATIEATPHGWRLLEVAPRRSALVRPDPRHGDRGRVLAANVDRVVIVVSGGPRPPRVGLIDRLLLAIDRAAASPLVCVNKLDLAEREAVDRVLAPFVELGISIVTCSARSGEGIASLRLRLARGRSVLVGHSGAGKTSLANALVPGLGWPTREVRAHDGKGRHATSAATLVALPGGGELLDTPGIRHYGLWAIRRADLDRHFTDLARRAAACRFADCAHGVEPGCAVRAAVESGELEARRYAAYRRLLGECEPPG